MVKLSSLLVFAMLLIAAMGARADSYESGDDVDKPRPHAAFVVTKVSNIRNGRWTDRISGDETPRSCSSFVLRAEDVRQYFQMARRASQREYVHDLDMSRCHATGSARFSTGERGSWSIDRERRGRLTLSDGRSFYFFCEACTGAVFAAR